MFHPSGLTRRDFARYLVAGSAASLAALGEANAGLYQKIAELNQKYLDDEETAFIRRSGFKIISITVTATRP